LFVVYLVAATVASGLLWLLGRKYGALGLLILSSPIHRLSVDIGFSLKPFYVVIAAIIVLNVWRAKGDPLVLRLNTFSRLVLWFLAAIIVSSLVNGASSASVRHIVVLTLVFAGCYLVQSELRTRDDITRLVDAYLVTGLLLGVSGLLFYGLYFVAPGLQVPGSVFDAVTYSPDQPWTLPLLQSVDVGSNAYALSLLPLLFVAMGAMMGGDTRKRRGYASAVFILLVANLLLTGSRGGVLAFLMTAVVWVFTLHGRKSLKVVLAVLAVSILVLTPLATRAVDLYRAYSFLKGFSGEDEALLSGRPELAVASLEVIRQHPVFGVGEGNITEGQYVGKQAHNTYLELLAENGVIASTIFMAILAWLCWQLVRARAAFRVPEAYAVGQAFGCGYLALLIAIIPTSAITMPLLWIQPAVIIGVTGVYRSGLRQAASDRESVPV